MKSVPAFRQTLEEYVMMEKRRKAGRKQMRILIAEDDQKLLKSLLHIYKINNYLADGVTNGTDALQYALTGNYDGLVLDIMMPGMDGIEVLKHLRSCGFPLRHCFSRQKPRFTSGLKVWTPERMSALIRKLISLARMDESDAGLETEIFNLSDAVTDSIAAFRPLPESRHLTYSPASLPWCVSEETKRPSGSFCPSFWIMR